MEERMAVPSPAERPLTGAPTGGPATPGGPPFSDPRALPILSTEHWSLLAGRSLVYNEAFSRAGMFLTFLSASLIALGLMSGAMGFSTEFLTITVLILALDLFIGLATMGRVSTVSDEDIRYQQGMNRIRHAYHEAVGGLEPYFISGQYDDIAGIFGVSASDVQFSSRRAILHGFTTMVGMVGVINAALAGVLVATIVLLFGSGIAAVGAGVLAFGIVIVWAVVWVTHATASTVEALEVKFPTPASGDRPAH
jgi:hypothetical protein